MAGMYKIALEGILLSLLGRISNGVGRKGEAIFLFPFQYFCIGGNVFFFVLTINKVLECRKLDIVN